MEDTWMKIVDDRLKRNCESSLTKYSIKAYKKQKCENKLKPNGLLNNFNNNYDMSFKIPIVHQYSTKNNLLMNNNKIKYEKDDECNKSTSFVGQKLHNIDFNNYVPNQMVVINDTSLNVPCVRLLQNDDVTKSSLPVSVDEIKTEETDNSEKGRLNWPGISEIMESYQRYNKGTGLKKNLRFLFNNYLIGFVQSEISK